MEKRNRQEKPPLQLTAMRTGLGLLSKLSPQLAAKAANRLWFKTRRFPEPRRETTWLSQATWKLIQVDGENIQLYQWGDPAGKPVLLTHGWNGRAAQLGKFAVALAAQGYRVLGFDAPAHGRSAGNQTNLPQISAVIQAIHRQEGDFAGVVAHSFGGLCVLHAVTQRAVHAEKIVCIATPHDAESLVDYFAHIMRLRPEVIKIQKRLLQQQFGESIWKEFSMLEMCLQTDRAGLIIHDAEDKELPVSVGRKISRAWKNSEFLKTSGLGHQRILRDDKIVSKVAAFIEDSNTSDQPLADAGP